MKRFIILFILSIAGCAVDDDLHVIVPVPDDEVRPPSLCPTQTYPTDPSGFPLVDVKTFPLYESESLPEVAIPEMPGEADIYRWPSNRVRISSACGLLRVDHLTVTLIPEPDADWTTDLLPTAEHPHGQDPARIGFLSAFAYDVTDDGAAFSFDAAAHANGDGPGATVSWRFDLNDWPVDADPAQWKIKWMQASFDLDQQFIPSLVTFTLSFTESGWLDEESGVAIEDDRAIDAKTNVTMTD